MLLRVLNIAFLMTLLSDVSAQKKNDSAVIVHLLKEDYSTMQNWDAQKHAANCTKDYLLIENGEIWDLPTEIKSYKANAGKIVNRTDSFTFETVKVFGNTAYDVHRLKSEFIENRKKTVIIWNESVNFRKVKGQWKIALIHSTQLSATPYAAFDHVALYVRNLTKSIAFYTELFQLDSIPVPAHGDTKVAWFQMNKDLQLHLVEGAKDSASIPFNHVAFSVACVDDFIEKLKQKNVTWFGAKGNFTTDVRADGVHQIYFRDPDGYEIEVNDRKQ